MDAVTKNWLSGDTIVEMTHRAFKKPIEITNREYEDIHMYNGYAT